jgi:hypothetical protein
VWKNLEHWGWPLIGIAGNKNCGDDRRKETWRDKSLHDPSHLQQQNATSFSWSVTKKTKPGPQFLVEWKSPFSLPQCVQMLGLQISTTQKWKWEK